MVGSVTRDELLEVITPSPAVGWPKAATAANHRAYTGPPGTS
ncbi:hypothetical protein ACQPZQ_15255 [Pseudonocardia sp. CA-142604]